MKSKLIVGATPTPATERALRLASRVPDTVDQVSMSVFEVEVDGMVRYCCWSGGDLIADPAGIDGPMPSLTLAGEGACEALLRLPYLYDDNGNFATTLVFHGLKLGATPLARKVQAAFRMTADTFAVICFVGDLAKELDGHMGPAFNVQGAIEIEDVRGMTLPGARP